MSALLGFFSLAEVEAAVLDRRIRRSTRDGTLSSEEAEDVSSALAIAAAVPLELPEATRVQAYQAIKTSGLKDPDSRPIVKSANELVRYTREVIFTPRLDWESVTGSSQAKVAYRRGAQVLEGPLTIPTKNKGDATEAIFWFSRAIDLAAGDSGVLIGALTMRATLYLCVLRTSEALVDAERLESIGGTDLSNVLAIEGTGLFLRAGREDLKRAVKVFTLAMQMEPPSWVASPERAIRLIDAFGNRGKAYYRLGQFEQSIQDSERVLELLKQSNLAIPHYFRLTYLAIIAANLQLGNIDKAKTDATEWLGQSNDPLARDTVLRLGSSQFDRQRWLQEYESIPQ